MSPIVYAHRTCAAMGCYWELAGGTEPQAKAGANSNELAEPGCVGLLNPGLLPAKRDRKSPGNGGCTNPFNILIRQA